MSDDIRVPNADIKLVLDALVPAINALPVRISALTLVMALLAGASNVSREFDANEETFLDLARQMFRAAKAHHEKGVS